MKQTVTFSIPSFKLSSKSMWLVVACVGIFLLGIIIPNWKNIYTYALYRDSGEREVRLLVLELDRKAVLPSGEVPGLATVTDKSKLNQGGVLARAQNGDKILLFYKAGEAIVYRPSIHKVVAIGPLIVDASAVQVKGTRIVIKNGSGDETKYKQIISLMKERYATAEVREGGVASRSDFPKTITIDITTDGKKAEFIGAINELIGGQRGIVPSSEQTPTDTDILIIVGKD